MPNITDINLKLDKLKNIKTDLGNNINKLGESTIDNNTSFKHYGNQLSTRILNNISRRSFLSNENGFLFDFNDLSNMYQDTLMTIPAAINQPVGLVLDKSKFLTRDTQVLSSTNDLTNASWVKENLSISTTNSINTITPSASNAVHKFSQSLNSDKLGQLWEVEIIAKPSGIRYLFVNLNGFADDASVCIDLLNTSITPQNAARHKLISISQESDGFFKYRFIFINQKITSSNINIQVSDGVYFTDREFTSNGTDSFMIKSLNVFKIKGNNAYQSVLANRPILKRDQNNGSYYLDFNGTSNFLYTSNINFTDVKELSLFANVYKQRDGAYPAICYFSASPTTNWTSINGTFTLSAGNSQGYAFGMRGASTNVYLLSGLQSPNYALLSFTCKLSNSPNGYIRPKHNGNAYGWSTAVNDAGSLGNYPLYIGYGNSVYFTGRIYSLYCSGRILTDNEVTQFEKVMSNRINIKL